MENTNARRYDRRIAMVLFGTLFSSAISQSFIFAVLPVLGREVGLSDLGVGLIASLPALAYVIAAPVLGRVVDRIGSLLLIRVGLLAGILSNLAFAWTIALAADGAFDATLTLALLLASRVGLNVAWGGMFPAASAYMALSTTASRRIGGMALLASASGIGQIAGPIVPSLVSQMSPVTPFYVVSAITALSLATTFSVRPAPITAPGLKPAVGTTKLLTGTTGPYFVVALLLMTCMTLVQQLVAFQMHDTLGFSAAASAAQAGQILTVTALCMLAGQWSIAAGLTGTNTRPTVAAGAVCGVASMIALVWGVQAASLAAFYISSALLGFALGILLPTNAGSLSLALPQSNQGQAAGFLGSAQGSGRIAGPLLATALYACTPAAPYWFGAAAFIAIAWLAWRSAPIRRPES
jgi:MFS family permease